MEHKDRELKNLVDRLMEQDSLDVPPMDFTDKVMQKLDAQAVSKTFIYRPLISKPAWGVLGLIVLVLVAYMYMYEPNSNMGLIKNLDLSFLQKNPLEYITIDFSQTTMYAFILFGVMIAIQIPLLKHYFNKRMAV